MLAVPENDGLLDPAKAIWHQPTIATVISKEADRNYQSLINGFGYFCSHIAPGSRVVQADQKRMKQHSPPGPILREKDLKDWTCFTKGMFSHLPVNKRSELEGTVFKVKDRLPKLSKQQQRGI